MENVDSLDIKVERVDDIPLIYGILERMGIQGIIDSIIEPHGNWEGLRPGWVITIWLVHILSQQNHRMEPVQSWVRTHEVTLERLTGESMTELDFTDDRLAMCLRDLSSHRTWHQVENQLGLRMLRVYDLDADVIRLDATLGTVNHTGSQPEIFQLGKSKGGQYETQFKLMLSSLDPLGLPLACDILPGNCADDPLYIPSYQRTKSILGKDGILVVGDSKMSALGTRGAISDGGDYYLTPLAYQKDAPDLLSGLLKGWLAGGGEKIQVFRPEDLLDDGSEPDPSLSIAHGFEVTRPQSTVIGGKEITWNERLLVVHSYSYAQSMNKGLYRRLDRAEAALIALTPPRSRGAKQIQSEAQLLLAIKEIEQKYRVNGFFEYEYEEEVQERHVRGYKGKSSRTERKVRFQLTVSRKEEAILSAESEAGWRIYATTAPQAKLSLTQGVLSYRDQIVVENVFRRLHGKVLSITPLYVQREDHAQGLINLLTIAARFLALGDHLAREALAQKGEELAGIYSGNSKRSTPRPTTERMLLAFEGINLVTYSQENQTTALLTGITPVHERIVDLLGLDMSIFLNLQKEL